MPRTGGAPGRRRRAGGGWAGGGWAGGGWAGGSACFGLCTPDDRGACKDGFARPGLRRHGRYARRRSRTDRLLQRERELRRPLVAVVLGLGHGLGNHVVDLGRQVGPLLGQLGRRLEEVRVHHRDLRIFLVGRRGGKRLVGDATERVDVRPGVERLSLDLLRRRVVGGADEQARLREARCSGVLRDTEVGQVGVVGALDPGAGGDEDVRRLHVPMDEPLVVRRLERGRDLGDEQTAWCASSGPPCLSRDFRSAPSTNRIAM